MLKKHLVAFFYGALLLGGCHTGKSGAADPEATERIVRDTAAFGHIWLPSEKVVVSAVTWGSRDPNMAVHLRVSPEDSKRIVVNSRLAMEKKYSHSATLEIKFGAPDGLVKVPAGSRRYVADLPATSGRVVVVLGPEAPHTDVYLLAGATHVFRHVSGAPQHTSSTG